MIRSLLLLVLITFSFCLKAQGKQVLLHDTLKVSARYIKNDTVKIPYTISKGQFKDEILYHGNIEFYNSKDELIITKKVKKGVEQEGDIFKGELVNYNDDSGKKTGKWVTLRTPYELGKFENSDNLFESISNIIVYDEGISIDTGYFYNELGVLAQMVIYGTNIIPPKIICFRENGNVDRVDHYRADKKYKFIRSESIYYSDILSYCILKRETYAQHHINFTYEYVNCELYSKTSIKEKMVKGDVETITREETIVNEGSIETITYTETFDPIPYFSAIPYSVEIGVFDPSETFLVDGKISYYSSNGTLIESNNVVNGVIIK